ncbi:uncharacterized protein AB9X84_002083 isoform 2-T2 [Acanthopagrus schlegelii]
MSFQQDAIELTNNGQRPASSVQPFQPGHFENEDSSTDRDALETDSNSLASLQEEEEEAENEGEDWVHLQPSCINMDDKMDDKRNLHV